MRRLVLICVAILGNTAVAESVIPSRTIRANTIISDLDVTLSEKTSITGYSRLTDVIGQETRVVLYAGRPIRVDDIGPPAIVSRNQIVSLRFFGRGLNITTEGRALERGAIGDRIRIMNLSSRATLFGQIQNDGTVEVTN